MQKMLGNGRLEAMCFDGTKRLCHIRGKLRKRQWINAQGTFGIIFENFIFVSKVAFILTASFSCNCFSRTRIDSDKRFLHRDPG